MGWNAEDLVKRIEDAAERGSIFEYLEPEETISPEERANRVRLESLRLSQVHTVERLKRATNPAHREMLLRALRHLEAEIVSDALPCSTFIPSVTDSHEEVDVSVLGAHSLAPVT
jgi:hypothetical protein